MNYHQYKEAEKNKVKGIHYWANECRKIQRSLEYNPDPKATVRHHLRDTEEQRKYNDEHYEYFGFNQDGSFEYGKYVIFVTEEEHHEIHKVSEETRQHMRDSSPHISGEAHHMYGKHHSEETKKKISNASKNMWQDSHTHDKISQHIKESWSSERRLKASNNIKGDRNPTYCRTEESFKASAEIREKISSAVKQMWENDTLRNSIINHLKDSWTDERRKNQSILMRGENNPMYHKEVSDETRQKLSTSIKASMTEETKNKISESHKGLTHSEETKNKISESHKGLTHSEETKQKLKSINTGRKHSDETKEKMRQAARGKQHTESYKESMRQLNKKRHDLYVIYKNHGGNLSWNEFQKAISHGEIEI